MKIGIGFAIALVVMFFAWALVAGGIGNKNEDED